MDNPVVPTPPTPPQAAVQPTASSLPESPSRRWFLWLAGGLAVLTLGVALGLVGAKFLNQNKSQPPLALIPTPTPSPTPTPAPDPTADWKIYTNTDYSLSFKYPNLDTKCCMIGGPFHGNATHIATFADATTTREGTDKPFDGFVIYIDSSDKTSLENYFNQERGGISGYYKEAYGQTSPSVSFSRITIGGNQAIVFEYKPLSKIYVLSLPGGGKSILIMTEETTGSFQPTFDLILSTFKFTNEIPSAPTSTINTKKLTYFLPSGWKTVQSSNRSFEVGYDPDTTRADVNSYVQDGISLFKENFTNAAYFTVRLMSYSGGSRHQFLYNYLGEKPAKEDLMPNYHEAEYLYDGKSCLFLVGISISQFPTTFGMCGAGGGKAFLITSFDNENYEEPLRTIKPL